MSIFKDHPPILQYQVPCFRKCHSYYYNNPSAIQHKPFLVPTPYPIRDANFLYKDPMSINLCLSYLFEFPSIDKVSVAVLSFLLKFPCGLALQRNYHSHFVVYIKNLITNNSIGLNAIIYALYLVVKFYNSTSSKSLFNIYALSFVTMMISCKFLYDTIYTNIFWARSSGIFTILQVNEIERIFLRIIGYIIWDTDSTFHDCVSGFFYILKSNPESDHIFLPNFYLFNQPTLQPHISSRYCKNLTY